MADETASTQLGPHGGTRTKGQQASNRNLRGGTNRAYLLGRLERDGFGELASRVRSFKMSASAAALAAGIIYKPALPDRPSDGEELEMWMGPAVPGKSVFPSEEAARACWLRWRDLMMARYGTNGKRPFYFWQFEWEGPLPRNWFENQAAILLKAGLLTPDERKQVMEQRDKPTTTDAAPHDAA